MTKQPQRRRPLPEPGLLNGREAAARLGVSDRTLFKLVDLGYLHPIFLGSSWRRFRAEDVEELIRGSVLRSENVIAEPFPRRPLVGAARRSREARLARESREGGEEPAS